MLGAAYTLGGFPPPPVAPTDARQILTPSELLCYWDFRPFVQGGIQSVTLSPTLDVVGSTLPTVTISGVFTFRDVRIDYPVGGPRGTSQYRIITEGGTLQQQIFTGTTGATPVDIGRGQFINFGNDANYTVNTTFSTATIHYAKVASVAELTGRANCTLTDTLVKGPRCEAAGLGSVYPSLYNNLSGLNNDNGVPAVLTGADVGFEVWMLYENWALTSSSFARVPWAAVNQTDTTKSFIDTFANGPAAANPSVWGLQRKNSAASPVTASLTTTVKTDSAPRAMRWVVGANGQVWIGGRRGRPAGDVNLNTGGTTTLNRFLVGFLKLGTSAITASAYDQGRWAALAITTLLVSGRETAMWRGWA